MGSVLARYENFMGRRGCFSFFRKSTKLKVRKTTHGIQWVFIMMTEELKRSRQEITIIVVNNNDNNSQQHL